MTTPNHQEQTMKAIEERNDPVELRKFANDCERRAEESFDRCDTDGFLTQWAHGINAREARMKAELLEAGGAAWFTCPVNAAGERVPARLVETRFGPRWAVFATWYELHTFGSTVLAWLPVTCRAKELGIRLGQRKALAHVACVGEDMCNVRPAILMRGGSRLQTGSIEPWDDLPLAVGE